jgi:CubicO group peptidase (beta-lactamase class C family)
MVFADDPKMAEAVQPFVDQGNLAGAVMLVASPDKVLSLEAVGYSDVGSKIPLKTDALFWIASMNKPITSTALMMLVDEGKVKLDDPVEKYLPEFKGQLRLVDKSGDLVVLKKPAKPITVRNILSHTAGLVGRSPLEGRLDSVSLKDGAISYGLSPLVFEPGSKYEYCNPGINTAGRIIEVASGRPYEKFLQERLLDPLGMKDTTFWPTEEQLKRLAKSYKPGPDKKGLDEIEITQLTYPLTDRKRHPYPAGGLFSTAEDLGTFCRMILNGGKLDGKRYLSENAVREMTSTQTGDLLNGGKGENGYGLGWSTSNKSKGENGPVISGPCGHGGAYATNMSIDPARKLVTVWMVQHAGFPGDGNKAQGEFNDAAKQAFGK